MTSTASRMNVVVNGVDLRFRATWTVAAATNEIRGRFRIEGGGVEEDDVAVADNEILIALNGRLNFVGGVAGRWRRVHSLTSCY
jgi:hypothetical protein